MTFPYRVRARWGQHLLADSMAAVEGESYALHFPRSDVRFDLFKEDGPGLWTLDPALGVPDRDQTSWALDDGPVDGRGVLSAVGDGTFVTFDHRRVRLEVLDAVGGTDERHTTVKRWPAWGTAADLIAILDVQPDGDGSYASVVRGRNEGRPVVEGSQMLGQAIVACGRHAPGRRVVSAHMVFMRVADAREPMRFDVEELSAGRTFSTLVVQVTQAGRVRATGTFLLDAVAPDVIRHAADAPATKGPYDSEPYDMAVIGRDLRVVDGTYTDDPAAPVGPPLIDAWVRFRDVPDDPYLHAGLLAQFTGHMPIAAALRPHAGIGQREAHRTLSTGINAIAVSFHADVRADQWMLYRHLSTFAGDGMTHAEGRVHDEAGGLLASFTVDAMVRKMQLDPSQVDDRMSM